MGVNRAADVSSPLPIPAALFPPYALTKPPLIVMEPPEASWPADSSTYKTLLTRGQKGCFVYCEDEALREYFKRMVTATDC